MSDYEKLEQALVQLIQCSKDADSEAIDEKCLTSSPSNVLGRTNTLKVVTQATDKLTESLGILHEFEMLMHDKTASLHIISNELVLNALLLHEQKSELVELRKKLKDISGKWYQSTEATAKIVENLHAAINEV
ncbi:uncharacterized protein LOC125760449 [Anopheles funestus]|uniref:Uncharacterized protein n=1 Tax=Anopheles funestus TaxID=62324 RepID=A0A182S319_ANOFN|nr:uncharacterized protein LOC125760449 [Anopheles funestus]